jgi:hypothetical protein
MAYATHNEDFGSCGGSPLAASNANKFMKLARRLSGAFRGHRESEVDREIARLLARSGGCLTDSLEREIMQKVFASEWSPPQ